MLLKYKNKIIYVLVSLVFLLWVRRGLTPAVPAPGEMPGGAANEPYVVVFSALCAGLVAWGLLEGVFWLLSKITKK